MFLYIILCTASEFGFLNSQVYLKPKGKDPIHISNDKSDKDEPTVFTFEKVKETTDTYLIKSGKLFLCIKREFCGDKPYLCTNSSYGQWQIERDNDTKYYKIKPVLGMYLDKCLANDVIAHDCVDGDSQLWNVIMCSDGHEIDTVEVHKNVKKGKD